MSEAKDYSVFFDYTRSSYWGGSAYSYWVLIFTTVVFGLFGFDHILLRSPSTAILKLIVNIVGLGFWWFYDMFQIIGNRDLVMKHGLTAPLLGPLGIGAGVFTNTNPTEQSQSVSPFRTALYFLLVLLPIPVFGLDFLVAGDKYGALAKCASMIIPLLWPIALLWSLMTIGSTIGNPKGVLESGMPRMFPFTWFMSANGPNVIGPTQISASSGDCEGFFGNLLKWLIFAIPGVGPAVTGVSAAVQATSAAVTAGAKTVETGVETVGEIIEAAKGPAIATVGIASGLAQQIPTAVHSATAATNIIGSQLNKYTNPDTLKKLSESSWQSEHISRGFDRPYGPYSGGGSIIQGNESNISTIALFIVIGSLLLGGIGMSLKGYVGNIVSQKKDGQSRDDTPPQPRKF